MYTYLTAINQTLYDVALQLYGGTEAIIWICLDNGLDLDHELAPGTSLKIRKDAYINQSIAKYYTETQQIVCTL
jgi:hypothetical protein